jgi:hypothetical protein
VPGPTWLATVGWRRAGGAIGTDEEPRTWRPAASRLRASRGPASAPTRRRGGRRRLR